MYFIVTKASAGSNVKQHVRQWKVRLGNDVWFLTINHRIYRRKKCQVILRSALECKRPEDQWSCIAHMRSCFILSDLGQRSKNDLDLWYMFIFMYSFSLLLYTNFYNTDFNSFWVIHHCSIFPYKCIRNENWPLCKTVKGQPGVIIWKNLVVLEAQCCIPSSKEEDF